MSRRSLAGRMHTDFRAFVQAQDFPCLGARAAVHRGRYLFRVYGEMGSPAATAGLARDLARFAAASGEVEFAAFVAAFLEPGPEDETAFEARLWAQLQRLSDADPSPRWAPGVGEDAAAADFAFSFAATPFFVVGLHPASSRLARRFGWPALVFNPHAQFEQLRADGRFGRLQEAVRRRDLALQGSLNPNLGDFGESSAARQYSGRAVEPSWRCPFQRRTD